jgi:hypothetical protein
MLSHRENVRTSKFWRKSKEKKRNFFRKFTKGIQGFHLGKKKFKIISCLCTFNVYKSLYSTGGKRRGRGIKSAKICDAKIFKLCLI